MNVNKMAPRTTGKFRRKLLDSKDKYYYFIDMHFKNYIFDPFSGFLQCSKNENCKSLKLDIK